MTVTRFKDKTPLKTLSKAAQKCSTQVSHRAYLRLRLSGAYRVLGLAAAGELQRIPARRISDQYRCPAKVTTVADTAVSSIWQVHREIIHRSVKGYVSSRVPGVQGLCPGEFDSVHLVCAGESFPCALGDRNSAMYAHE
jgi:hypothetical protein